MFIYMEYVYTYITHTFMRIKYAVQFFVLQKCNCLGNVAVPSA